LEYSNLQKAVGSSSHARTPTLGAHARLDFYQKLNSIFGSELLDNSLRVREGLLKGGRAPFSLRDVNLINSLGHQKSKPNKPPLAVNLSPAPLLFKIGETTKRIVTAGKDVVSGFILEHAM
jgi:hypothetical protein